MLKKSSIWILMFMMVFSMFSFVGVSEQASAERQQLLSNPGFEEGINHWYAQGAQTVIETVYTNSGSNALKVFERVDTWGSAVQNITSLLQATGNGTYTFSGYIRMAEGTGQSMTSILVKVSDDAGDRYLSSEDTSVDDQSFTEVTVTKEISWTGTLHNAEIYFNTQNPSADYYVDDVALTFDDGGSDTIPEESGPELLTNPGFEDGLSGWYVQGAQALIEEHTVNTGSKSVKVYDRQGAWGAAVQNVTGLLQLNGSGMYTYSGHIQLALGEEESLTSLILKVTDDAGDQYLSSDEILINDQSFTKVTTTNEISWTGTLHNAELYFYALDGSAEYYIDDFSLVSHQEGPAIDLSGPELLNNPDFEDGVDGWYGQLATAVVDTEQVYAGEQSIKLTDRTADWSTLVQDVTAILKDNGRGQYTFSGFAKLAEGEAPAFIVMNIVGKHGQQYITSEPILINGNNFVELSATQIISWDGDLASAQFYVQTQGNNMTDMYIDHFSLKKSDRNLALDRTYQASDSAAEHSPEKAFDGDDETSWLGGGESHDSWLEIDFGEDVTFNKAFITANHESTEAYEIQYWDGSNWQTAYTSTSMDSARQEVYFETVTASKARMYFNADESAPNIAEFAIYMFNAPIPDITKTAPIEPPEVNPELRKNKTLVGAIRWDAWIGEGPGLEVEKSLGPEKYHDRLPFYATIIDENQVEIRATTQEIIDQEIAFAKDAGLDYWAFDWYPQGSGLDIARNLYFSSEYNEDINWCVILGTNPFDLDVDLPWLIDKFKESNYQTVLDDRPLVYYFNANGSETEFINKIRTETEKAGVPTPYIVAMGWGVSIAETADLIGADAISSYVVGATGGVPYADLMEMERQRWDDYQSTGKQVVPSVTTGWDKRTRHENPVSWESPSAATEWVERATPEQIAAHLKDAIDWNNANPDSTVANTALIYAWNENDEGGWIIPTLFEMRDAGQPLRLNAIREVLKPSNSGGSQPTPQITNNQTLPDDTVTVIASEADIIDSTILDEKGKLVQLIISPVEGAMEYKQVLPASVMTDTAADTTIEISSDFGTIIAPSTMFNNVDVTGEDQVAISIAKVDASSLPADVRAVIGQRPVIALSAFVGDNVIPWNNPSSPVTVSIPYQPSAEELANPEHIVVWYIDNAGHAISVPNGRYDQETGRVVFKTTHFSQYAVAFVFKSFDDLTKYDWAQKQIEVLASKGIISGTSATTFNPSAPVTRADYVKLVVDALELTSHDSQNFNDVNLDMYYAKSVGIAKALRIISGVGDDKFNPDGFITRQDAMVVAASALKSAGVNLSLGARSDMFKFSDAGLVSDYAMEAVSTLVAHNIVQGSDGYVYPAQTISRAEAAVLIYQLFQVANQL